MAGFLVIATTAQPLLSFFRSLAMICKHMKTNPKAGKRVTGVTNTKKIRGSRTSFHRKSEYRIDKLIGLNRYGLRRGSLSANFPC